MAMVIAPPVPIGSGIYWLAAHSACPQKQAPPESTPVRHEGEQYSPSIGTWQVQTSWAHFIDDLSLVAGVTRW